MMGRRAGVYLGDERLTVVVVEGRGGVQHFAAELSDVPGARLKAELDARQLGLRRVRVGLARPLVTVKAIDLPRAEGGQLADMVAFELERHVPFPPEDMRFDWAPLPSPAQGSVRVLVTACERRTVDGALRLVEESGLKPAALTVACHDLPALLARRTRTRWVLWAHRSGGATDLVCLAQGRLQLSRTVPTPDTETLVDEVSATLTLLGWSACDAIWVSGDGADELQTSPALGQLAGSLSEPPWSPAARAALAELPADDLGKATLALAVALGSRRPALNLLPVELRPRTFSAGQLVTAAMVGVTALLGLGLVLGQGYQQQRYLGRVSEAIRELDPEVKAVERLAAELAQKKRLMETIDTIEKVEVRPLPVMRELTERLPQDAWLRTLSMDKQGIEITGQAGAANQLIPLLENSPFLARVEFTAPVTKAGDKEQFRIKAAWKTPPRSEPPPAAPKPAAKTGAAVRTPGPRPSAPGAGSR